MATQEEPTLGIACFAQLQPNKDSVMSLKFLVFLDGQTVSLFGRGFGKGHVRDPRD